MGVLLFKPAMTQRGTRARSRRYCDLSCRRADLRIAVASFAVPAIDADRYRTVDRHAAHDARLLDVTLGAAGLQDMAPVRAMLADGVDIQFILIGLKRVTDRRIDPQAPPIASWRGPRFLESVARSALLGGLLPKMVSTWAAAGTAPAKTTEKPEASSVLANELKARS
jgi:hypothetical protein